MIWSVVLAGVLTVAQSASIASDTVPAAAPDGASAVSVLQGPSGITAALLTAGTSSPSVGTPYPLGASLSGTGAGEPDDDPQYVEYSDAYFTRYQIHKWASYLTIPLFVGQYIVGEKLLRGEGSPGLRGVHGALAAGVGGLFLVNTITGVPNAIEARKDPEGKNRRTLHSTLMLLADAGFVATALLAGENENEGGRFQTARSNNNTHKIVAITSMGAALLGYTIMLPFFGGD